MAVLVEELRVDELVLSGGLRGKAEWVGARGMYVALGCDQVLGMGHFSAGTVTCEGGMCHNRTGQ